jgi:hypothetical protein
MKRLALALGHAATQAPQPMHCGGVHGLVGDGLRDGDHVGVGRRARARGDVAARLHDAVEGAAVDHEVLDDGERVGAPRLDPHLFAVLELAHVELAGGGGLLRPVGLPLTTIPHMPQMPSRQSWSKAMGSLPFEHQALVHHVEELEERRVRRDPLGVLGTVHEVAAAGALLAPHVELEIDGFSHDVAHVTCSPRWASAASRTRSPRGTRLLVELGLLADGGLALVHSHAATWEKFSSSRTRRELAVLGLVLLAEVAARALVAGERVAAHQLARARRSRHAAGLLERRG